MILLLLILAQTPPSPETAPAEDLVKTFVITMTDGTVYHGTYQEAGEQAVIQIDTPWKPEPPFNVLRSRVSEVGPELRHKRDERRVQEAAQAGFSLVQTPAGTFYVAAAEVEKARRAREMAVQVMARGTGFEAAGPVSAESTATDTPAGSTAGSRWGLQAGILLAGLIIAGIVLKVMVFRGA